MCAREGFYTQDSKIASRTNDLSGLAMGSSGDGRSWRYAPASRGGVSLRPGLGGKWGRTSGDCRQKDLWEGRSETPPPPRPAITSDCSILSPPTQIASPHGSCVC